jgi:hypothetical protein
MTKNKYKNTYHHSTFALFTIQNKNGTVIFFSNIIVFQQSYVKYVVFLTKKYQHFKEEKTYSFLACLLLVFKKFLKSFCVLL